MWLEIFKFECKYRLKRPETYLFFVFTLSFSLFGVDFIFQGVELGLVKHNAPMVIAKAMGAITGIFMILASMIMGMPMIRDHQYNITPLIYTNPVSKFNLLFGRFLGSFFILVIIFTGLPIGMMLGEFLPWHSKTDWLPFQFGTYISNFFYIVMPILFFASTLFFVTGTLSRKLLVVYTQGVILFVLFLLTKSISNESLQAILDPFSLTTITQVAKDWSVANKNMQLMPLSGILLVNKIWWTSLGFLIIWIGYRKFSFNTHINSKKQKKTTVDGGFNSSQSLKYDLKNVSLQYGWKSQLIQWFNLSIFYLKLLLKETSFWAIVICGAIIIIINSINLGTVYNVNSFPTTYLIIAELQELSIYFFVIILLFYSAELYCKEDGLGLKLMSDATAISSLIRSLSKISALIGIFIVLMIALTLMGIVFQISNGYYHFDLCVYFIGFFIEILPFLILYTFVSFFLHTLVNNKFLGILLTLIFFIAILSSQILGFGHVLFSFGGGTLNPYSELNGYGHFMMPYLWVKIYWILFGLLLTIFSSLIAVRGTASNLKSRLIKSGLKFSIRKKKLTAIVLCLFLLVGGFIYYQSNILNKTWSKKESEQYRANYEKTLKQFEYLPQPKITHCDLHLELFPDQRSYHLKGKYILKNIHSVAIKSIHVQKLIESNITLKEVSFSIPVKIDSQFQEFEYMVYELLTPLSPGDSMTMDFYQIYEPKGFDFSGENSSVIQNGTFIRNTEFPTFGYFRKYELRDSSIRELYGLSTKSYRAAIDNINELSLARAGSDSDGVITKIVIGTKADQCAVTSGELLKTWKEGNRNYFEYISREPMINFFAVLSGEYAIFRDRWIDRNDSLESIVNLEIYHHPSHYYNLERMMNAMKASLSYYTTNFSPYQYEELRIVEFPRYEDFAQSFPNTIPFSESLGFMLDINDPIDVDMTFFITAHEVAHQWWGMQVEAANVVGQHFILETMAQYSALMVFKETFSEEKVNQLLVLQKEKYEAGKQKSKKIEAALSKVDDESHIYYHKGALVMYQLQQLIGEEKINQALNSFINDWNTKKGSLKKLKNRYATSDDLISYFLGVCQVDKKEEVLMLLGQTE